MENLDSPDYVGITNLISYTAGSVCCYALKKDGTLIRIVHDHNKTDLGEESISIKYVDTLATY